MKSRFSIVADKIISKCIHNLTASNYNFVLDTLQYWKMNLIDKDLAIVFLFDTISEDDEDLAKQVLEFLSIIIDNEKFNCENQVFNR